jgi:pyruvate dehydrogenase E2 component (dihydrolipoamide acetyltransferase)
VAEFYEMPAISPTMEMGTLVEWKIAEGQAFESSAVVAEVGTDKANMEAEIFDDGVLLKHLVAEGDEIPPGYPIAIWGRAADEPIDALLEAFAARKAGLEDAGSETPTSAPETPAPTPAAERPKAPSPRVSVTVERTWMGRTTHENFMDPPGDIRIAAAPGRIAASPLAKKVAADLGVDLQRIQGTGPGGRIVRSDVENAPRAGTVAASVRPDETVRNSPMRKTIARRLLASHTDIPTFFLTATFDMRGFVDLRTDLKAKLPDVRVSYNDILILAVARSLRNHPNVNASWGDTEITRHGRVDIGMAVALPDGLITPVIRGADGKSLSDIGRETRELAGRARDMQLAPDEYTGGTFTISNLGMMQIEQFTAIINPPEAAILAVGAIESVPVVVDGGFEIGHRMKVTLTCDHRVIDGASGAAFLQTVRTYVESPYLLLV